MMSVSPIVVVPATTNLLVNPSAETDGTFSNQALGGATRARDTAQAYVGDASFKIDTPGGAANQGVAFLTASAMNLTGSARPYVARAAVLAPAGAAMKLETQIVYTAGSGGGSTIGTATTFTGTGAWQEIRGVAATADPAKTINYIALLLRTNANLTISFWADALQIENRTTPSAYGDGSLPGWSWAGTANQSASVRAQQRVTGLLIPGTTLSPLAAH